MLRNGEADRFDQEKAFQILNEIINIDPKNGKALFYIIKMLYHGEGTGKNKQEARVYYKRVADYGYKKAIYEYAILIEGSFLGDPDKVEAYKYELIGCINGDISCIRSLAYDYLNKDHPFYNHKEGEKYWKYVDFKGNKDYIISYAFYIIQSSIKSVFNKCIDTLKSAADNDKNSQAIQKLIEIYKDGAHADKGFYVKYLKMGADDNYSPYQFEYGKLLFKGEKVPKDIKQALKYIKKASKHYCIKAKSS